MSPGFTPRPWLSVVSHEHVGHDRVMVSPGFTPRPWLSGGQEWVCVPPILWGVAGVYVPALVERTRAIWQTNRELIVLVLARVIQFFHPSKKEVAVIKNQWIRQGLE